MEHYLIIIEKGESNFSAYSPDVSGCVATGGTVEETLERMRDALYFHLEDIYQRGGAVPKPQGLSAHMKEIDTESGDMFAFVSIELEMAAAA